ncbi:MAG: integrin [Hydrogenophaga sp.]|uniref:FG-GAP repeat protein n=1 Tax=Hydrogenophaga sp. TaxID=1904254 RepID=UPI00257B26D4|nr:integrin [Hydrogenophaga sp.]MBL0943282.1 integrin [Hydrogenophaga sp.]
MKSWKHRRARASLATLFVALTLAACGGGGGGGGGATGGATDQATGLQVSALDGQTYRFSWPPASGATELRLMEKAQGQSDYSLLDTLPPGTTVHDVDIFLPTHVNASYILRTCQGSQCTDSNAVTLAASLAQAGSVLQASNMGADDGFGVAVALSADGTTLAVGAMGEDSATTTINGEQRLNDTAPQSGAVYVFTRGASGWTQQAYLKAANAGSDDRFGLSLALSADGHTLAVGAPLEDSGSAADGSSNTAPDSGAVYVFGRAGSQWTQTAYLKAFNAASCPATACGDQFGGQLALSADGQTLAVGAIHEGSDLSGVVNGVPAAGAINQNADNSGAVYVFAHANGSWQPQAYLKAANAGAGQWFGYSLALAADGSTLAVGAPGEDSDLTGVTPGAPGATNGNATDSGAVYLFARAGTQWRQTAYVKASNTGAHDNFGFRVALSTTGDTLAVSALLEDSLEATMAGQPTAAQTIDADVNVDSGAVYVFAQDGNGHWAPQAYLKASNPDRADAFGRSLALSGDGNTIAVGAATEGSADIGLGGDGADNDRLNSGAAYVFTRGATGWTQQAYMKAPLGSAQQNALYGYAVALAGQGQRLTLAVGAVQEDRRDRDQQIVLNSGAVHLY